MASLSMEADYDFVEKPSEDFYCPVTMDLLRDPFLTPCCGNHLSPAAVVRLQGRPCPVCKEASLIAVPDKFFQRKVNELKVRCPNKSMGCEWVGELGDLDKHMSEDSVEGECQFVLVACPYSCGSSFQRYLLEDHKANDCPSCRFVCQYCNHEATYIEVMSEHWSVCDKYPAECPNNCGDEKIERQHLPKHLEETCPLQVIKCEFSYAGCEVECQRQHMQTHLDENVKVHLSNVSGALQSKTGELQSTVDKQQKQIMTLMAALARVASDMHRPIVPIFVPPPDMLMTGFEEHRKKDYWLSPPFYTHTGGYKLLFNIVANGWGVCKGTHVSVYVYLMRGEHDDYLKWPFRGAVTIQLLNRKSDEGHKEATFNYNDSASDEYAGRVVGQERADGGWGSSSFIAHSDLNTEDREYLQNDCLLFRIPKIVVRSI